MTERVDNSQVAERQGAEPNEIVPDRGSPRIKPRKEQNLLMALLPVIIAIVVIGGVAIGGWFAWHAHQLSEEQASEGAGNVASKTSIGKRRNDDVQEHERKLGADGEEGAPATLNTPTQPAVPAIMQDNPRQSPNATAAAPAQPIAVQGNGQSNQPVPAPRSRFDAPMHFGSAAPDTMQGGRGATQAYAYPATQPAAPGTTMASPGTRPDYSLTPVSAAPLQVAEPPPPKGSLNLQTLKTEKAEASLIGNRDFLLAKGSTMDCDLDTAMRSNQPGMVRCSLTKDIWSDNGRVLLAERGSSLTGEYTANIQQGQSEIQVIWSRLKTTQGAIVNLASPATDALGRTGVDGVVDNHWGQRVGAAFLLSFVKDAIGYATATQGTNSATPAIYGNTTNTGNSMADTILKQTINIPPTINRDQGTRIKVFVARDLDFSKVYALKLNRGAHE